MILMVITMKSMMMRWMLGGNFTIRKKLEPQQFVMILYTTAIEDRVEILRLDTVMNPEGLGSVDEAEVVVFVFS